MSDFTKFRRWRRIPLSRDEYALEASLAWEVGRKGSGLVVIVPKGFVFDISVPWFLRWWMSRSDPQVLPCAALHDWLLFEGYDLAFASGEMRRALRAKGVGKMRSYLIWAGTLVVTAWNRRRSN